MQSFQMTLLCPFSQFPITDCLYLSVISAPALFLYQTISSFKVGFSSMFGSFPARDGADWACR